MTASKRFADIITWSRAAIAVLLPVIGIVEGADGLQLAVVLLITNWTADSIDGVLARRSRVLLHTWIGDHDLEIDMLIAAGSLAYLVVAGFLSWQLAIVYTLVWLVLFWRLGIPHVLGVLFQAPIYGYFIVRAIVELPKVALWMVVWIVGAIIVTWPKFPKVIIPDFLKSVRDLFTAGNQEPR